MSTKYTLAPPELMTAEEFYDWAHLPENEDTPYELEDGKVVEMSRPGEMHGVICWIISVILGNYVMPRGGYLLLNDTGLIVRRKPDSVRGPDLMLYLKPKSTKTMSPKYCETAPDLVVEVYSPTDRPAKLDKRIKQYLTRGIPLVWVAFPEESSVSVYRPNQPTETFESHETLDGGNLLPGFQCLVADLFRQSGESAK